VRERTPFLLVETGFGISGAEARSDGCSPMADGPRKALDGCNPGTGKCGRDDGKRPGGIERLPRLKAAG